MSSSLDLRGQKLGIIVDEIDDIQEIVVKPLGALFSSMKMFSGNTILGDGSVILIVDPGGVAAAMNIQNTSAILPSQNKQERKRCRDVKPDPFQSGRRSSEGASAFRGFENTARPDAGRLSGRRAAPLSVPGKAHSGSARCRGP